jgi:HEAT repeat protein
MRIVMTIALLGVCENLPAQEETPKKPFLYVRDLSTKLLASDAKARLEAAKDLEKLADGLRFSVANLRYAVEHDADPGVRCQAALTLGNLGSLARNAIPTLIKLLDDKNADVRAAVVASIGGTAPFSRAAIPKLIKLLKDKDVVIRRRAIRALGRFGPEAKPAVPVLVLALEDPDPGIAGKEASVKEYALLTLREIGPDAQEASSALMKIQEAGDVPLRGVVLGTLAKILPKDPKLVPLFAQVLKNQDNKRLRPSAAYAIGLLGPDGKAAVPDLIKALKMDDFGDRDLAVRTKIGIIWALGEIGPDAKEAISTLDEIASRGDRMLRAEAADALKKIQRK